jgi:hypothetical protein
LDAELVQAYDSESDAVGERVGREIQVDDMEAGSQAPDVEAVRIRTFFPDTLAHAYPPVMRGEEVAVVTALERSQLRRARRPHPGGHRGNEENE